MITRMVSVDLRRGGMRDVGAKGREGYAWMERCCLIGSPARLIEGSSSAPFPIRVVRVMHHVA